MLEQPRPRKLPFSFQRRQPNAERFSRLGFRQAAEVAQFDDFGGSRMICFQTRHGLVKGEQVEVERSCVAGVGRKFDTLPVAIAFGGVFGAGVVYEQAAHLACGDDEKVVAVMPFDCVRVVVRIEQAQVKLMYERGWLQRVMRVLLL